MDVEIKENYGFKVLSPMQGYKITETTVENEAERGFYKSISMPINADETQYTEWSSYKVNKWKAQYENEEYEESGQE